MTPTRKRRLIAFSLVLIAVAIATTLTVFALGKYQTYLFSPTEVLAGKVPADATFKLGGVVLEHSVKRDANSLKIDFTVTDRFHEMPVEYTGILPDLFREGQSIIATGTLSNGRFAAREVLAKHDETYMPKEVADAIAKAKTAQAAGGQSK
jgi:cytochrome c-type biogenesis protein CcmE